MTIGKILICLECKKEYMEKYRTKFCSRKCSDKYRNRAFKNNIIKYEASKEHIRKRRLEHLEEYRKKGREKYHKNNFSKKDFELLEKIYLLIGDKCLLCGSNERISFHEIYGKPHPTGRRAKFLYIIENYKDFVTLCGRHHAITHFLANSPPPNIDKLVDLITHIKYQRNPGKSIDIFQ